MQTSRISAQEFMLLNEKEQLSIVDVRTPMETAGEYLAGSIFLPVQELTPETFDKATDTIEKEKPIYLLCQRGIRADTTVKKLENVDGIHLVVIEGGLNELKDKGQVTNKGASNIIALDRQVRIAAGALVLTGVLLGMSVNTTFYALSAFVGAGLVFSGVTNTCGLGVILSKMPWNKLK